MRWLPEFGPHVLPRLTLLHLWLCREGVGGRGERSQLVDQCMRTERAGILNLSSLIKSFLSYETTEKTCCMLREMGAWFPYGLTKGMPSVDLFRPEGGILLESHFRWPGKFSHMPCALMPVQGLGLQTSNSQEKGRCVLFLFGLKTLKWEESWHRQLYREYEIASVVRWTACLLKLSH